MAPTNTEEKDEEFKLPPVTEAEEEEEPSDDIHSGSV